MPTLLANRITQYYESSGDLNGPTTPILLIHGLGSSSRDWEYQWSVLGKDHPLIAPDLRGHGKTDKPDMPYSVPMFANDIASILKSLMQQPVHVVGLSLGGMIALQLTLDHPELVKSMTVINSGPAITFPSVKMWFAFHSRKWSVKWFGMKMLSEHIALAQFPKPSQAALRATFIQRWNENDPKAYQNALAAFHLWDVTSRLKEIQCPTLIVCSDNDYTPIAIKAEYLKYIPHGKLVIIHDSRHLSPVDQPEQCNAVLQEFLQGVK